MSRAPLISIGLPVHNGANYVAQAIESVLRQSCADFELIISDNASDDETARICREYAARDDRVRYSRLERNIGAAENFNRTFRSSSGRYFKWIAHDDVLAPDFLSTSLELLEADPDVVLCYSAVDIIDGRGDLILTDDSRLPGTEKPRVSDRFAAAVIIPHMCFPVFALIRSEVLRRSALLASYDGSDRALVAELAVMGRFAYTPRPLFGNRDHPARYIRAVRPERATGAGPGWWAGSEKRASVLHLWALYADYFRMIRREVRDTAERRRCYRQLAHWLLVDWNALRLVVEVAGLVDPRVLGLARTLKQRLFRAS